MSEFSQRAWRGLAPNSSNLVETANYIWNTDTLAWEPASGSSTGTAVTVDNFPATQTVAGTVTVLGAVDTTSAAYSTRLDEASATVTYVGQAAVGAVENASSWQIKRITISSGTITKIEYADSDANYNNNWSSRTGLTYG